MGKCILVVDDEVDVRRIIAKRLSLDGFEKEILQASNPLEAFDIFNRNKHRIDTIICDQYMPIQNGADFCALVKRDHPHIKIFILTGDKKLVRPPQTLNADLILYKPEDLDHLIEKIKEVPNTSYRGSEDEDL